MNAPSTPLECIKYMEIDIEKPVDQIVEAIKEWRGCEYGAAYNSTGFKGGCIDLEVDLNGVCINHMLRNKGHERRFTFHAFVTAAKNEHLDDSQYTIEGW